MLNRENVYWEEYNPEDTWPKWVFIQFKSFTNSSPMINDLTPIDSEELRDQIRAKSSVRLC
jgi:hypothetical protein